MLRIVSLSWLFAASLLASCVGGQTGSDPATCDTTATTDVAAAARSSIGFSATELLASLAGPRAATLVLAGRAPTRATIEIGSAPRATRLVERSRAGQGDDAGNSQDVALTECSDSLEVDLDLTIATEDGALDEVWAVTLSSKSLGEATATAFVDLRAVQGNLELTARDEAEFDPTSVLFTFRITPDAVEGEALGRSPGEPAVCAGDEPCEAGGAYGVPVAELSPGEPTR